MLAIEFCICNRVGLKMRGYFAKLLILRLALMLAAFVAVVHFLVRGSFYALEKKSSFQAAQYLEDSVEKMKREIFEEEERPSGKKHLLLFIAVLNRLELHKRRSAIRSTWMSECDKLNIICRFFTDPLESLSGRNFTRVKHEFDTYFDMISMPYTGGNNFSLRLVWMLKWVVQHYTFDFFLRIDDDHFLCLDRLVYELPSRPKQSLYWGYIHCRERIVRVDEGWLMLTSNLVQEALSKLNSTLQCHPFADQAVALWMIESEFNVTYFYDNDRVMNRATAFHAKEYLAQDICNKYLSLHGSYPRFMRMYWNKMISDRTLKENFRTYNIPAIPRYSDKCQFSNKVFDFNNFWPQFRFHTKPCKNEPKWSNSDDIFPSREDIGEEE